MEELLAAGLINLDKPIGPTSHQVTAWVREILGVEKIGHGGTLDPKVSGVLPIATGKATKATDLVLRSDKEYVCMMTLHRDKDEAAVRIVLATFLGDIYQLPPVRAAVKRQMRVRNVHSIKVLEIVGRDVLFRVNCDAGTYIRTLCVDVGEALGIGAHMEDLRRTRSGSMLEGESAAGSVLGMATMVVNPPRAAARLPESMVSAASLPGCLRWTWTSIRPGVITKPRASIIVAFSGIFTGIAAITPFFI